MEVKEIITKAEWNDFLLQCEEKTFLDSWNWGEFQKRMGEKIWRLGIYDNGALAAVALVIRVSARRGKFLFIPHGPNLIQNSNLKSQHYNSKFKILEALLTELKKLAREEKASFIRIGPIWDRNEGNEKLFRNIGFQNAPTHMHPEVTWELGIMPSEDELLAGMRKTTRYLIRQAQKNEEIKIEQSRDIKDVEVFYNLHKETVNRHHFTPFSLEYMKKEFESFARDNEVVIFHGEYRGELVASAIIIFWQGAAYYHHGATSLKYPKIPVAYLLQWEVIREAKRRGCTKYNFWGIAPSDNPKHPWAGLTLFKTGFGGYRKEYVKTQDFVLSWKYWPAATFEFLRRWRRGL